MNLLSIGADNDSTEVRALVSENAYMLRVLSEGAFCYRSTNTEPTAADVSAAMRLRMVKESDELASVPALRAQHVIKPGHHFNKPAEDKLADVEELRRYLADLIPALRSITISYEDATISTEYIDTHGREITSRIPVSTIFVSATGGWPGNMATVACIKTTTKGSVLEFVEWEDINKLVSDSLVAKLDGVSVKSGVHPAVLGPSAVGTLCHEAVGHLSEASSAEKGLLYGFLGKKIAAPEVSIVDAPTVDGPLSGCDMRYDDEGTTAIPVRIVDHGVVRSLLTDLLYSKKLDMPPTGNSRAMDGSYPELIRMRNTYMERGEIDPQELIGSIKEGYLITAAEIGQTNPTDGTFYMGIEEGYKIKRGEIVASLRTGAGINGFTIETLADIDGVGSDFEIFPGACIRYQQVVRVSSGGPHVRLKGLRVS
jgi:TldD protein